MKNFATKLNQIILMSSVVLTATATHADTAQSLTSKIAVTANVIAVCKMDVGPTLALGNYDAVKAHATDALSDSIDLSMTCTKGSALEFNISGNQTLTQTDAKQGEVADKLNYVLSYGMEGGEQFSNNQDAGLKGTGTQQVYKVTVTVPGQQNPAQGAYSDTLTATLKF